MSDPTALRAEFEKWALDEAGYSTARLPSGEYADVSPYVAWNIWQAAHSIRNAEVERLKAAALDVMRCIQIQHRPPVRDELECGRMVLVRLHALADLKDALDAGGWPTGEPSNGAASSLINGAYWPTIDAALSASARTTGGEG